MCLVHMVNLWEVLPCVVDVRIVLTLTKTLGLKIHFASVLADALLK